MAFEAKLLKIASPAGTGTQAYTGVGFQPKAIILYSTWFAGDGTAASSYFGFGMGIDSSNRMAIGTVGDNNDKNHGKDYAQSDEHVIYAQNTNGVLFLVADLDSMDSDGFTLDFTTNTFSIAWDCFVLCLGGDDLTDVALENITSPGSTGTQAYTGAGFQPDFVMAAGIFDNATPPDTGTGSCLFGIGFGTSSTDADQWAQGLHSVDGGTTTDAARYVDEGKIIVLPNSNASGLHTSASIDSIDATGVTLDWTTVGASGMNMWLLYIKGGSHKVGIVQEASSATTVQTGDPGFGSEDPVGIFCTTMQWTALDSVQSHYRLGMGAATDVSGTDHGCIFASEQDTSSNSDTDRAFQSDEVCTIYTNGLSLISEAHISDFDSSTGVEFNWTTADVNQRHIGYWTFANTTGSAEGSGGVTMGGSADVHLTLLYEGTGGIVLAGETSAYNYEASGGVTMGGEGDITPHLEGSGGVIVGGEIDLRNPIIIGGIITIGGAATAIVKHYYEPYQPIWPKTLVTNISSIQKADRKTEMDGGVKFAAQALVRWPEGVLLAGNTNDKLYVLSGQFTSTVKTSLSVGAVDTNPHGITWDLQDTTWCGTTDKKIYLQSGRITSTIKSSGSVAAVDILPRGVSLDRAKNLVWMGESSDTIYTMSGGTSTAKGTAFISSADPLGWDVTVDGSKTEAAGVDIDYIQNNMFIGLNNQKFFLLSGQFSSTVKTSLAHGGVSGSISWDGRDTLWGDRTPSDFKLRANSGQFTSTVKTSLSITSIDNPTGLETTDFTTRVGVRSAYTYEGTGGITVFNGNLFNSSDLSSDPAEERTTAGEILTPNGDGTTGDWEVAPLWSKIDEGFTPPDTSDYITAETTAGTDTTITGFIELSKINFVNMQPALKYQVRTTFRRGNVGGSLSVQLYESDETTPLSTSVSVTEATDANETWIHRSTELVAAKIAGKYLLDGAKLRMQAVVRNFGSGNLAKIDLATVSVLVEPTIIEGIGGVTIGGSADVKIYYNNIDGSGGVEIGGQAGLVLQSWVYNGSGGVIVGGEVDITPHLEGTGGITIGGGIDSVIEGSGGVTIGGEIDLRNPIEGEGGVTVGGEIDLRNPIVPEGGVTITSPSYPDAVEGLDPIAYWKLGDTGFFAVNSGTIGDSVDGVYANVPTQGVPGLVPTSSDLAVQLDGANDQVQIPSHAQINTSGPYTTKTIDAWIRTNDASVRQVVYKQGNVTNGLAIYVDDNKVYGAGWTSSWTAFVSTAIESNKTYHVTLTFDEPGSDLTIYSRDLDGNLESDSDASIGTLPTHAGNVVIGGNLNGMQFHDGADAGNGQNFDGIIDEVVLYDSVITPAVIAQTHDIALQYYSMTIPVEGSGGVTIGGEGDLSVSGEGVGGVTIGGSATARRIFDNIDGSGGVTIGGEIDLRNPIVGSGGVTIGGGAGDQYIYTPTGGVTISGRPEYTDYILAQEPIAFWQFNDTGFFADNSGTIGSAVDATYVNGALKNQTGIVPTSLESGNGAAVLDGINDQIEIPSHAQINTSGPYTTKSIEAWFRADVVTGRRVIYKQGNTVRGLGIYIQAGRLYVGGWNTATQDATTPWQEFLSTPVSRNVVYHVVLTFDQPSDELKGYLNGIEFGTANDVGNLFSSTGSVVIGSNFNGMLFHTGTNPGNNSFFDGTIDDVALYDSILTATEIAAHNEIGRFHYSMTAPAEGSGGVTIGGEAELSDVGGAVTVGGAAEFTVGYANQDGTGGVTIGGEIDLRNPIVPEGGVAVGGTLELVVGYITEGTGGVVIGGSISLSGYAYEGTGGVVIGGSEQGEEHYTGSGGVIISGSAAVSFYTYEGTGGITIGGASPLGDFYTYEGTGGITIGGSADAEESAVGVGGIVIGGSADAEIQSFGVIGAGGLGISIYKAPDYDEFIIDQSPIVYFKLDETVAFSAINYGTLGSAVAAIYTNIPSQGQPGIIPELPSSNAVVLDGNNDQVEIDSHTSINSSGPYTAKSIEVWFKADETTSRQVIYKQGDTDRGLSIYLDAGKLYVGGWNTIEDDATTPWEQYLNTFVINNTIYHVVLTFDQVSDELIGYLNGESFGTATGIGRLFSHGAKQPVLGANWEGTRYHDGAVGGNLHHFGGTLDEFALYNSVLTSEEVAQHYSIATYNYSMAFDLPEVAGGVTIGGAADAVNFKTEFSGGVEVGGTAEFSVSYWSYEGSGGVIVAGVAGGDSSPEFDSEGSGGVVIGGEGVTRISGTVAEGGVVIGGSGIATYDQPPVVGSGGVTVYTDTFNPTEVQVTFNVDQEFTWDTIGELILDQEFTWDVGEGELFFFVITSDCISLSCETADIEVEDDKCGAPPPDGQRVVSTVAARSVPDLCTRLKDTFITQPITFPIQSIKKFSRPVFVDADTVVCQEITEVEFCDIEDCVEFCLDSNEVTKIGARVSVQETFLVADEPENLDEGVLTLRGSALAEQGLAVEYGGLIIGGSADVAGSVWAMDAEGGVDVDGTAAVTSSSWNYTATDGVVVAGTPGLVSSSFNFTASDGVEISGIGLIKSDYSFVPLFPLIIIGGASDIASSEYQFIEEGSGGVTVGGEGEFVLSNYFAEGNDGVTIGGTIETVSNSWSQEGTGGVSISGLAFPGWSHTPSDGVTIGGAVETTFDMSFTSSGGVTIGGMVEGNTSTSHSYSGSEGVTIGGEADDNLESVTIDIAGISALLELSSEFAETTGEPLSISSAAVTAGCNCDPMPANLQMSHNFNLTNKLNSFLARNNFSLPTITELRFRDLDDIWQRNYHFLGTGEDGESQERWNIIFNWQCTDIVGGENIGSDLWKFCAFFRRENLTTGADYDSRIMFTFPTSDICLNSNLRVRFILDTRTEVVTTDPDTIVSNSIVYDGIGLFKNKVWFNDPELDVIISQLPISEASPKLDISPIFPEEPLLV